MKTRRVVLAALLCAAAPAAWAAAATPELLWDDLANITKHDDGSLADSDFPVATRALAGKPVTVHGWMTPINLGDGTTVTSFLLTGTPGTCPFCFGAHPENFVLISATRPVPVDATVELVLIGRFEISPHDETGFYYRLRDAVGGAAP